MTALITEDLVRAAIAEREREVQALLRASGATLQPRGLRAGFAARLVRAAFWLHREAASRFARELSGPSRRTA